MRHPKIAVYSIILGGAVLCLWGLILSSGPLPEGISELTFHLVSEALMALACISGGILLLRQHPAAHITTTAAHAMVVYSTLNAAGYYLENGTPVVSLAMTALAGLSTLIAITLIRSR